MGHIIPKLPTLLVDTEMFPRDFKVRGLAKKQGKGFFIMLFKMLTIPEHIKSINDIQERRIEELKFKMSILKEYIRENKIQVLILDCIYKLINDQSRQEIDVLCTSLLELRAKGVLCIIVHHLTKSKVDDNTPLNSIAGHSDLNRVIEGGIVLIREGTVGGLPRIRVKYDVRAMAPLEDKIVYLKDGKHMTLEEAGIEDNRSPMQKLIDVLTLLPALPDDAIPTDDVIALLVNHPDIHLEASYIREQLRQWVKSNLLSVVGNRPKCYYQGPALPQNE